MIRTLIPGLLSMALMGADWPQVPDPIGLGPRLATIDWLQERGVAVPADATDEAIIELWAEASGLRERQREEAARLAEAAAEQDREAREARERRAAEAAVAQARANERSREPAEDASAPAAATGGAKAPAPAPPTAGAKEPATAGGPDEAGTPAPFPDFDGPVGKAGIIAVLGPPDASYRDGDTEHLLYARVFADSDGEPYSPDLLLKDDRYFQRTYIRPEVMRRNIAAARNFAGWEPPKTVSVKTFSAIGADVRGYDYGKVTERFGQPDVKKVFNGHEIWVYHQVPFQEGRFLSLYVTFEKGIVLETAGN